MRNTYQRLLRGLRHLSPQAAWVLKIGAMLWGYLMICALVLLLRGQPFSLQTYPLFLRAAQLQRGAFAVYFCTGFLACFVEEQMLK